jgi:hypothetical protein
MGVKESAKQVIDALPEAATMDDVIHALYVTLKFRHGESEIRGGRGILHGQARSRLQKWLK